LLRRQAQPAEKRREDMLKDKTCGGRGRRGREGGASRRSCK